MLIIRKIVLFKTGIGYVEKRGSLDLTQNKLVTFSLE